MFSSTSAPHPSVKILQSATIPKETKKNVSIDNTTFQNSKNVCTDLPPSIIISNSSQQQYHQQHPNQQQAPVSPNAQLYQKLLKLISSSSSYSEQINSQMNTLLANPNIKAQLKQLHSQLLKNPNQYLPQLENILLDKDASTVISHQLPVSQLASKNDQDLTKNQTQKKNQKLFENYRIITNKTSGINNNMTYNNKNYISNKNAYLASELKHKFPQDLLDLREYYANDEVKRFTSDNHSTNKSQPILNHSQ